MSCPVVPGVGAPPPSLEKTVEFMTDSKNQAKVLHLLKTAQAKFEACEIPLQRLNECQRMVMSGSATSCVKEATCFLACEREQSRIKRACDDRLQPGKRSIHSKFLSCLHHEENEKNCVGKLEEFVSCLTSN